jgi:hypothetical protein
MCGLAVAGADYPALVAGLVGRCNSDGPANCASALRIHYIFVALERTTRLELATFSLEG